MHTWAAARLEALSVRGSVLGVGMVLTTGCAPTVLPPDFGGEPLWEPLTVPGEDRGESTASIGETIRRDPEPIRLVDATAAAGLDAMFAGGNTHGVGIGFLDLTGDEYPDIVLVNGRSNVTDELHPSRFLVNRGDGSFVDRSQSSGLAAALSGLDGYSVAAGDLDDDGDVDLYIGAQPRDVLLLNDGAGRLSDATAAAGAGGPPSDPSLVGNGKSKVVSIGDIDGDGKLDLVSASSTLPAPGVYVLRNLGDGRFEDVTEFSGVRIDPIGNPCAVMLSDYDSDGDRDLWVWNDRGGKVLLANDGRGRFDDVTAAAGLDMVRISNPMGIDAADIDRDGDLDYYVSNIGNNPLLRNNGDGTFVDITMQAGTGGQYGWGLGFEDFNLDGWPDLFVAQEDDRPHLIFEHNAEQPPRFDRIEVEHPAVANAAAAHNVAVAFADYDRDGRVDVVVAGTDGRPLTLFRNDTAAGTGGWLQIRPEPQGVGARVVVATGEDEGEVLQFRDVSGGSSRASQNELSVRFGLGAFEGARWVGVLWPTGEQALVYNVGANQVLRLRGERP